MIVTNLGMNLVLRQLTVVFSLRASVTLTIEDHPLICTVIILAVFRLAKNVCNLLCYCSPVLPTQVESGR